MFNVLKATCDEKTGLGYKGWISAELFNRSLLDDREDVPREYAERCIQSWRKIVAAMGPEDVTCSNDEKVTFVSTSHQRRLKLWQGCNCDV